MIMQYHMFPIKVGIFQQATAVYRYHAQRLLQRYFVVVAIIQLEEVLHDLCVCVCVYEIRIGCTSTCCLWNQTSIRILPIQNPQQENSTTEPKRDRHCLWIVVVFDDDAVSSSSS